MRKAGAFSLLALAGVLLAQESPHETATDSLVAAAAQLAALVGHRYEALDAEARAALTPALVVSLETFRDEAIARGVEPMPIEVLEAFDGHLPDDVLASVRWRIEPESLLIGWNVLQSGMRAVTLDNLILFASAEEAANVKLWAHELYHALQYRQWGIEGFVEHYLVDRAAVEREAWEFRWQWMKATGRAPITGAE
ncbi:MAG: DUF4157 domain-containing protein [Gammaproteobacteria bacterium]|nr:DUF4157 domain-containing protein [Gammaproteobacteria bacterium]